MVALFRAIVSNATDRAPLSSARAAFVIGRRMAKLVGLMRYSPSDQLAAREALAPCLGEAAHPMTAVARPPGGRSSTTKKPQPRTDLRGGGHPSRNAVAYREQQLDSTIGKPIIISQGENPGLFAALRNGSRCSHFLWTSRRGVKACSRRCPPRALCAISPLDRLCPRLRKA